MQYEPLFENMTAEELERTAAQGLLPPQYYQLLFRRLEERVLDRMSGLMEDSQDLESLLAEQTFALTEHADAMRYDLDTLAKKTDDPELAEASLAAAHKRIIATVDALGDIRRRARDLVGKLDSVLYPPPPSL